MAGRPGSPFCVSCAASFSFRRRQAELAIGVADLERERLAKSVLNPTGSIETARMPSGATSVRRDSVSASVAALPAES